jgi:Methylamine utilisation protein MauE
MVVLLLLNAFLACMFAESAYHKLNDMAAFRAALADYRLVRGRPGARRVAYAVTPAVELVLAVALVTPAVATVASYAAVPLLVVFLVLLVADDRPAFDNCGCASKEPVPVPRQAFTLRTALLLVAALAAAGLATVEPDRSWTLAAAALAVAVTFPLAHVVLELPLIMHIHEVDRRQLPDRVRQARRVYALDGDSTTGRREGT